ncbi:MAG: response regulator [Pirellulales bacterium]
MNGTVYVVDDDRQMRKSFVSLLDASGYKTRNFASAEEFLEETVFDRPSCALIDVRLEGISGLEVPRRLASDRPKMPIVFISGYASIRDVVKGMREGAADFLEKPCPPDRLLECIRQAIAKDENNQAQQRAQRELRDRLTQREQQVVELLAEGRSVKQVAAALNVTYQTVNRHRAKAMRKLGVDSVIKFVRLWKEFERESGSSKS